MPGGVSLLNKGQELPGGIPPVIGGPGGGSVSMPVVNGGNSGDDLMTTMMLMDRLAQNEKQGGGLGNMMGSLGGIFGAKPSAGTTSAGSIGAGGGAVGGMMAP